MKIKTRERILIGVLLVVLVGVLTYFIGYRPMDKKNKQTENDIAALQTRYDQLMSLKADEGQYKEDIANMNRTIEEAYAMLPSYVSEEQAIMFAKGIEDNYDMTVSNITLGQVQYVDLSHTGQEGEPEEEIPETVENQEVYDSLDKEVWNEDESGTASGEGDEVSGQEGGTDIGVFGSYINITMTYTSDFETYQAVLDYIRNYEKRTAINSTSMNVIEDSETGQVLLSGSINVTMYALVDADNMSKDDYDAINVPTGNNEIVK